MTRVSDKSAGVNMMGYQAIARSRDCTELRELDLDDPEHCRWYLYHVQVEGQRPTFLEFVGGRRIEFKNMSDDEAVEAANLIYEMELQQDEDTAYTLRHEGKLH